MIDYKNCDMTIDELSTQANIRKDEIIADIAKKYNKSIIEVNNWIKIGKGNVKVATNILDGLSKYKRMKTCPTSSDKTKKEDVKPDFFANNTIDFSPMSEDEFSKISKEIDEQYFESCNKISNSKPNDIVNQLQKKKYVISQKNETSPIYLKMDGGEVIEPFYHNKKHEETVLNAFVKDTIYDDVKSMIKKYPNIEEIIKEVRAELSQNHSKNAIDEGDVYTTKNIVEELIGKTQSSKDYSTFDKVISSEKSDEETHYNKFNFEQSKNIMDKSCGHIETKSYSNEELYQMIENLTTEVNVLATEIGTKVNTHNSINEQSDTKQNLKEIVLKIIEKL